MNKGFIRKIAVERLAALGICEKRKRDMMIYSHIMENINYKKCNTLFIFVSYKNEVDTQDIIKHALSIGKTVAVPVILSKEEGMVAVVVDNMDNLVENKYGILEPPLVKDRIIDPREIQTVIVPGAAFDRRGGRVGYGAGMYDKYLPKLNEKAKKIAVAYSFQVFDSVPMEVHDILMDEVITD